MLQNCTLCSGIFAPPSKPSLILGLALLATSAVSGCASTEPEGGIFDFATPSSPAQAAGASETGAKSKTEAPRKQLAEAALGALQSGPGYKVRGDVSSNGRYNIYTFETGYGTYNVTGDALARRHIRELAALDALGKRSKSNEFAHGVGDAVTSPFQAVYATVTDPAGAAEATYSNTRRAIRSVGQGVSDAGEYIATSGNPKKRRPDREDDSMFGGFVGVPEAKRRLAAALDVDPYTHFKPLAKELDKVASYSAAGKFGINTAVGFVSGGAGTVISGLQAVDSITERTLSLSPGEAATVNRERLEKLGLAGQVIEKFLLNDKLTPTEKTQAVGSLSSLAGTQGLAGLVDLIGASTSRHDAYAALQLLAYLSGRPFGGGRIAKVDVVDRIPVVTLADGRQVAILTSDDLAWTQENASQLSALSAKLDADGKRRPAREMRISGKISALAQRALQRQGWIVQANTFNSPLEPFKIEPATAKSKLRLTKASASVP